MCLLKFGLCLSMFSVHLYNESFQIIIEIYKNFLKNYVIFLLYIP